MPKHTETRYSPYSAAQLYALVMDVEKYPEFLPWCRAARVLKREDNGFIGELVISFKQLSERYSSKVIGSPGNHPSIEVSLVSGPFEYLHNHWKFIPRDTGGTDIQFMLDFKFKSRLLEALIGSLFTRATEKMTQAFLTRAESLYKDDKAS